MESRKYVRVNHSHIADLYKSGHTQSEIADIENTSQGYVWKILKKMGVECKTTSRKHNWDFSIFRTGTPELAYWMGFCFADGCAQYRGQSKCETLAVCLAEKDFDHLAKFVEFVGGTPDMLKKERHISVNGPKYSYSVFLCRNGIFKDLHRWGIVPRKSWAENFIQPDIPKSLIPPFVRGWIDGDGHVISEHSFGVSVSCNRKTAPYLNGLLSVYGITSRITSNSPPSNVVNVRFHGLGQARRLLENFGGYPRLERKWAMVERWLA